MTELWTPSDELIAADGIATAKIDNPHDPHDLEAVGVLLPESDAGDAIFEAAAAVALAEIDDSDPEGDLIASPDDEAIEDFDEMPIDADI